MNSQGYENIIKENEKLKKDIMRIIQSYENIIKENEKLKKDIDDKKDEIERLQKHLDKKSKSRKKMSLEREKIKTHPNFKSFVESVVDATGIYDKIGERMYDDMDDLERKVLKPCGESEEKNLKSIKIDLEKIDRLYYIDREDDEDDGEINVFLTARMRYGAGEGNYIYIDLAGSHSIYYQASCGDIAITRDAELFLKFIHELQETIVYRSLIDDGILVKRNT